LRTPSPPRPAYTISSCVRVQYCVEPCFARSRGHQLTIYCPTLKPDEYSHLARFINIAAEIHQHMKDEAKQGRIVVPFVSYAPAVAPADVTAAVQFLAHDSDYFLELFQTVADGITERHSK
jgi:hypothetical protein